MDETPSKYIQRESLYENFQEIVDGSVLQETNN